MNRRNFLQTIGLGVAAALMPKVVKATVNEIAENETLPAEIDTFSPDAFEKWLSDSKGITWYHYSYPDPHRPGKFITDVRLTLRDIPLSHLEHCEVCQESMEMFGVDGRAGEREWKGRWWRQG